MGKSRSNIKTLLVNERINDSNKQEFEKYPYKYKGKEQKLLIKQLNVDDGEDWETFKQSLKKVKQQYIDKEDPDKKGDGWRVETNISKEDYKDAKLYITDNGSTLAIKSDGDIAAVCSAPSEPKGAGLALLQYATDPKRGGTKLDSFSGNHGFYIKAGFEPVTWVGWDKTYETHMIEQGWKPGIDKREPIIFYRFNPDGAKSWIGSKSTDFTGTTNETNERISEDGKTIDAYTVAYQDRDKTI